jgi:regulatory protein
VAPKRGKARGAEGDAPEEQRKRALAAALRMIARRGLTASELDARLAARGFERAAIEAAVERLREVGYVDEAAVADAVAREAARKHQGSRRVAQVLARRGVTAEHAERALRDSEEHDVESARALVLRRFPGGVDRDRRDRARAFRWLVTRGYPPAVARSALDIELDEE